MKFRVLIPCTMGVSVLVDADDEEAAKEAALNVSFGVDITGDSPKHEVEITEFETHDRIAYGNVYCGCVCNMEVEKEDEES